MKEIIFWFNKYDSKNYWLDYAIEYWGNCLNYNEIFKYNRIGDWIQIGDLKIRFKVDKGPNSTEHIGIGDINQYWVEELFDNNFEEFFKTILKEEIKNE